MLTAYLRSKATQARKLLREGLRLREELILELEVSVLLEIVSSNGEVTSKSSPRYGLISALL
jgi:hypothetical protein